MSSPEQSSKTEVPTSKRILNIFSEHLVDDTVADRAPVRKNTQTCAEERRIAKATELYLPPSASWEEIRVHQDQNERGTLADALKWGLDPAIIEEQKQAGQEPYPSWRTFLAYTLNMTGLPKSEEITKEFAKRIEEARRMFRKLDKNKGQE